MNRKATKLTKRRKTLRKGLYLLSLTAIALSLPLITFLMLGSAQNIDEPIIIDGDTVEYSADAKEIIAQGNVVVTYEDAQMNADKIVVNNQTKEVVATGNVRLQDSRGILEAEKLIYNFQTSRGDILQAKMRSSPYYYFGETFQRVGEDEYIVKDGYFSSCNYDHPHYRMKSKKIEMFPGDKIIAHSNTAYWMNFPFFYFPKYSHSLKDPFMKVQFKAGKTSDWGPYLLSAWRSDLNENARLRFYFDWRQRWGTAQGFGLNYDTNCVGKGDYKFYYTNERRHEETGELKQEFQRYLVRLRHMWDIDEATKLTAQYYRIQDNRRGWHSDADFLQDYFYREYETDTRPRSYLLVNRALPNSSISMLLEGRTNRWYGNTVERLPEVTYDLPSYKIGQIGRSQFYFNNQTKFSNLAYADSGAAVIRFDSDNKFLLSRKVAFVDISPYARIRETVYSRDNQGSPISPRTTFYTGIDMSTKFYRIFNLVTNFLGLDINHLRHIITPTITYGYTHDPTVSSSKLQQFDSIDSIASDNRFTLTLENKLQTKRKEKTCDLAIFRVSSDYIMYSKAASISKGQDRFTDFILDLELTPFAWLRMEAEATYNHRQDYFSTVNLDSWLTLSDERKFGLGHCYSRGLSKEMTYQSIWRINPKWKFRVYGRYSFMRTNGGLREQEYTIFRDLHCGILEISFNRKKKAQAKTDKSIFVGFNLKIFKESEFDYVQSYHPPKTLE